MGLETLNSCLIFLKPELQRLRNTDLSCLFSVWLESLWKMHYLHRLLFSCGDPLNDLLYHVMCRFLWNDGINKWSIKSLKRIWSSWGFMTLPSVFRSMCVVSVEVVIKIMINVMHLQYELWPHCCCACDLISALSVFQNFLFQQHKPKHNFNPFAVFLYTVYLNVTTFSLPNQLFSILPPELIPASMGRALLQRSDLHVGNLVLNMEKSEAKFWDCYFS